jgi:hypothetical protein
VNFIVNARRFFGRQLPNPAIQYQALLLTTSGSSVEGEADRVEI